MLIPYDPHIYGLISGSDHQVSFSPELVRMNEYKRENKKGYLKELIVLMSS